MHEVFEFGELIVQVGPALDAVLRDDRYPVKLCRKFEFKLN